MREVLASINLKELLKVSVFPIFVMLYILYPLWMLSENPLVVVAFGYGILAMPFLIRFLIDTIWPESSKEIDVAKFTRSRKIDLFYFFGTALVYWVLLFPLIFAPLLLRGDEPTHIGRVVALSLLWTFDGMISNFAAGIILMVGLFITVVSILVWSSRARESFFLWPLFRLLFKTKIRYLLYAALAALPILMGIFSIYFNVGTYSLTRYGPFHPVVFVLPFLLLGYSTSVIIVWKTMTLFIMVGAAAIIRRLTAELLEKVDEDLGPETKTNRILSMVAGWLFLALPPVIQFSVEVYLTAGVALFFAVNCLLLLRTVTASSEPQQRFYLVALALFLGFSSLWKRVLLVQAVIVFIILLLFLVIRGKSDRKQSLVIWLKTGFIYACIFGPWFIIVQLQGYIWREYIPVTSNLLPPHLFDYLLRFDVQLGTILGIAGYIALGALFVIAIAHHNRTLTILAPQFAVWYLFFNLDAGWEHNVDRFFVPVLSLLTVSLIVTVGILIVYSRDVIAQLSRRLGLEKPPRGTLPKSPSRKSMITFLLLITLIGTTVAGTTQNIMTGNAYVASALDTSYVPYGPAAQYIAQQIGDNLSLLYSVWGPSSLNFYLNMYGDYAFIGDSLGQMWIPNPNNVSTEAFVEYLKTNGYSVLAFPSANLVDPQVMPPEIVQSLIENYAAYGITHLEVFTQGSNDFYVWLL